MRPCYIFVTGGVVSGVGKGITTSSIGKVLQSKGYAVTVIKIDPYLNVDAGTLRPTEHGEVWVTEDGGEIDQDLGHYERFLDINLSKEHNITTGQIYSKVIENERQGNYLGKTVEVIPQITDEIKRRIGEVAEKTKSDFILIEIGGTVGEYQNEIYYRTARMMRTEGENIIFVHVVYLPILKHVGEMKTKPAQQSVELLGRLGIQPDFLVVRSEKEIDEPRKEKLVIFCNVKKDDIISNPDLNNVYELPLIFEKQNFGDKIIGKLNLSPRRSNLEEWKKLIMGQNTYVPVKIGVVGKYFDIGEYKLPDSYISVIEAIKHAAWFNKRQPEIEWIDSKVFENDPSKLSELSLVDGVIVPGGFGKSGIEGKIAAIENVRKNKIPFLGLCLGLQLAVVEFARNVCGLKDANSTEFNPDSPYPVIDIMPEQKKLMEESSYGATMRLGTWPAKLKEETIVWEVYGKHETVMERHRHRYEVNPIFHQILQDSGLIFSGVSPDGKLVEFIEIKDHPYFVATQAHPEFKSRPLRPAPLFDGFIKACIR